MTALVFVEGRNPKYFNDPELTMGAADNADAISVSTTATTLAMQPMVLFQRCRKISKIIRCV